MSLVGEMLGVIFMGVFSNPSVASSVTALILAISGLISSGFLVYAHALQICGHNDENFDVIIFVSFTRSLQNMLAFFQTISWANIFKYSSEIFMANEFHQLEFTCDEGSGN